MSFYTGLASTATKLLKQFGQQVTLSRKTETGFDPATGAKTTASSSFQAYAAIFDYKQGQIDGESILMGDKNAIMEAASPPKINDVLTSQLGDGKIVSFETLAPAGQVVIYVVQLRY